MEDQKSPIKIFIPDRFAGVRSHVFFMLLLTMGYGIQVHFWGDGRWIQPLVLIGWGWSGILGYMWLHLGIFHILESLVTVWIFGRKLAMETGLLVFGLIYISCGLVGAITHVALDGRPLVGASGAIMGLLGAHATLFFRDFSTAGQILLVLWLGLTLGLSLGEPFTKSSHVCHLGGFLTGIAVASFLMRRGVVDAAGAHPDWRRWLAIPEAAVELDR